MPKENTPSQSSSKPATSSEDRPKRKRKPRRRSKSKTAAQAEPDSEAESEPEPEAESEPEPEVESKPKSKPEPESAPRRKSQREPEAAAESKPVQVTPAPVNPDATSFAAMGLSDVMLNTLTEVEYLDPTPIQSGLIPLAMTGVDVMGQAQTGTGKTAAFGIPILEQLQPHKRGADPQALVLAPTRELAVQVRDECSKLGAGHKAHVVAVYGGKPIRQQIEKLRRGVEIVVGTPGRVMDLMDRGVLMFGGLRFVVLDEADRMLDIGFRPDIEKILRRCPQSRQTLLLSATIPPPVERLAQRYMRDPKMLDFSPKGLSVETIEQFYFTVDPMQKFDLLVKLIEREDPTQAIIFCRTKRGTDKVARRLSRKFKGADTIHGDLAQTARDRVMRAFRDGKVRYLVATDVVGRGIDVTRISHIINYDTPQFCDDYVHRVGRTGRMGREGVAFTFVTPEEGNELTRIEMRINLLLKRDDIPGFAASQNTQRPEPTADGQTSDESFGRFEPPEPPKPKPVFGSRNRRHRRAL